MTGDEEFAKNLPQSAANWKHHEGSETIEGRLNLREAHLDLYNCIVSFLNPNNITRLMMMS